MSASPIPRIAPLEPPYDPPVAESLAKMMPPGTGVAPLRIFRTMARHDALARRVASLGGALHARGRLDLATRELAILRTTATCGAEYEWGVHVAWLAGAAGLTEAQIRATVRGGPDDPAWSAEQALVIRAVDELHTGAHVSDAVWDGLRERWDDETLLELLVVVGFYHAISFVVNGARIAHEDFAARFP